VRGLINRAIRDPKRIVFPEGDEPKIIRAAAILVDDGIAQPILLGSRETIENLAALHRIPLDGIAIEDPATSPKRDEYTHYMWQLRQRKGLSLDEARRQVYNGNYFGSCMVARGDADALLSGANLHYPETIRPALQVIGAHPAARVVSGMYMLVTERHVVFCADTTVNIDPTAEQLAQIAFAACRVARTMGVTPRVAMLSFSNFGSVRDATAEKMARAARLLRERDPSIVVDGEMQADTALDPEILARD
jgi:malate dehydrogenase (oxaloacetate-decarboxylating)(NADP+)